MFQLLLAFHFLSFVVFSLLCLLCCFYFLGKSQPDISYKGLFLKNKGLSLYVFSGPFLSFDFSCFFNKNQMKKQMVAVIVKKIQKLFTHAYPDNPYGTQPI